MNNSKTAKRSILWAIELSEFDIQYCLRMASKLKHQPTFITEFKSKEDRGWGEAPWIVKIYGSPKRHVGVIGIFLQYPERDVIECVIQLHFPTTNKKS